MCVCVCVCVCLCVCVARLLLSGTFVSFWAFFSGISHRSVENVLEFHTVFAQSSVGAEGCVGSLCLLHSVRSSLGA